MCGFPVCVCVCVLVERICVGFPMCVLVVSEYVWVSPVCWMWVNICGFPVSLCSV